LPVYSSNETDCENKNVNTNRDTLGSISDDYCTIDRLSYCKKLTASKQSARTTLDFGRVAFTFC
ncbi:hypothetical protein Bpfe_014960, partial [Biomphalaria pfeifferi]